MITIKIDAKKQGCSEKRALALILLVSYGHAIGHNHSRSLSC